MRTFSISCAALALGTLVHGTALVQWSIPVQINDTITPLPATTLAPGVASGVDLVSQGLSPTGHDTGYGVRGPAASGDTSDFSDNFIGFTVNPLGFPVIRCESFVFSYNARENVDWSFELYAKSASDTSFASLGSATALAVGSENQTHEIDFSDFVLADETEFRLVIAAADADTESHLATFKNVATGKALTLSGWVGPTSPEFTSPLFAFIVEGATSNFHTFTADDPSPGQPMTYTIVGGSASSQFTLSPGVSLNTADIRFTNGAPPFVAGGLSANEYEVIVQVAGTGTSNQTFTAITTETLFNSFIRSYTALGISTAFDHNTDHDMFPHGIEWVLGGQPDSFDALSDLVVWTPSTGTGLTLVFERNDATEDDVTLKVNYGGSLDTLSVASVTIGEISSGPNADGVTVAIVENGDEPDTVTVVIPDGIRDKGVFATISAAPK